MKQLYAIRHKRTGFYLPEPTGRAGRGGSHTEPIDCSGDGPNPRLFVSELSAKRALSSWLQGKHLPIMGGEYSDWDGRWIRYQEGTEIKHQSHRVKEDMEVVSFNLTPVENKQ